MAVRHMGHHFNGMGRVQARLFSFLAELLGKDPELIPKIIPDRKEARGYELADVRRDADALKAEDNQIIEYEIGQRDDGIAAGHLRLVLGQLGIFKDPIALQRIIYAPTYERRN